MRGRWIAQIWYRVAVFSLRCRVLRRQLRWHVQLNWQRNNFDKLKTHLSSKIRPILIFIPKRGWKQDLTSFNKKVWRAMDSPFRTPNVHHIGNAISEVFQQPKRSKPKSHDCSCSPSLPEKVTSGGKDRREKRKAWAAEGLDLTLGMGIRHNSGFLFGTTIPHCCSSCSLSSYSAVAAEEAAEQRRKEGKEQEQEEEQQQEAGVAAVLS